MLGGGYEASWRRPFSHLDFPGDPSDDRLGRSHINAAVRPRIRRLTSRNGSGSGCRFRDNFSCSQFLDKSQTRALGLRDTARSGQPQRKHCATKTRHESRASQSRRSHFPNSRDLKAASPVSRSLRRSCPALRGAFPISTTAERIWDLRPRSSVNSNNGCRKNTRDVPGPLPSLPHRPLATGCSPTCARAMRKLLPGTSLGSGYTAPRYGSSPGRRSHPSPL